MSTKEENEATITALLEERRGYIQRGLDDRVKDIDAQLKALGGQAETSQKRSQKRPAQTRRTTRA